MVNPGAQIFQVFWLRGRRRGGQVRRDARTCLVSRRDAAAGRARGHRDVEEADDDGERRSHRQRKELLSLHREAAEWFHRCCSTVRRGGTGAALLEEPRVRRPVARALENRLRSRGPRPLSSNGRGRKSASPNAVWPKAGFLRFGDEDEGGATPREPWFRFAGRLMFPICNEQVRGHRL